MGLIGGGGSILTVPILVYFFAKDPLIATTDSLFIVGITALLGALLNARKKCVDYKMGALFAIPSFAGVFVARKYILPQIPDVLFTTDNIVLTKSLLVMSCFAVLMILASRAMIRSGKSVLLIAEKEQSSMGIAVIGLKGFSIGLTTGFVGAGGGFLIIPALVLLLKIPMRRAVGTSLAIIAANSLFGFVISQSTHIVEWKLLLTISGIAVVGILIGQKFGSQINEQILKRSFGYFVLFVGSFVLIDQALKLK